MWFDTNLHFHCPKDFTFDGKIGDLRNYKPTPYLVSDYKGKDLKIGGLTCHVRVRLSTRYEKPLNDKLIIAKQDAYLQLFIEKGKEEHGKLKEEFLPILLPPKLLSPEKTRIAYQISRALAKQFKADGYHCEANNLGLKISLADEKIHSLDKFSAIYKMLKYIESKYEHGQKPLGHIDSFSENGKPKASPEPLAAWEKKGEEWKSRAISPDDRQQREERKITISKLLDKYFSNNVNITEAQHALFLNAAIEVLGSDLRELEISLLLDDYFPVGKIITKEKGHHQRALFLDEMEKIINPNQISADYPTF